MTGGLYPDGLGVRKRFELGKGGGDTKNAVEAEALTRAVVGDNDEVANFASRVRLAEKRDLVVKLAVDSGGDDFGVVRSLFHFRFLSARFPVGGGYFV